MPRCWNWLEPGNSVQSGHRPTSGFGHFRSFVFRSDLARSGSTSIRVVWHGYSSHLCSWLWLPASLSVARPDGSPVERGLWQLRTCLSTQAMRHAFETTYGCSRRPTLIFVAYWPDRLQRESQIKRARSTRFPKQACLALAVPEFPLIRCSSCGKHRTSTTHRLFRIWRAHARRRSNCMSRAIELGRRAVR